MYDIEALPADSSRPGDVADFEADVVAGVAREEPGRGAVAAAFGVSAANGDLRLRLRLRLHRLFVGVGEGGVVVVGADDGLVVVAVVHDGNGAEEFEPPLPGLESAAGVLRLDGFVRLGSTSEVLALISCARKKRITGINAPQARRTTTEPHPAGAPCLCPSGFRPYELRRRGHNGWRGPDGCLGGSGEASTRLRHSIQGCSGRDAS